MNLLNMEVNQKKLLSLAKCEKVMNYQYTKRIQFNSLSQHIFSFIILPHIFDHFQSFSTLAYIV